MDVGRSHVRCRLDEGRGSLGVQSEVVATGWMSQTDFLTGLALIQALPGPLFNLAAYIGARASFVYDIPLHE